MKPEPDLLADVVRDRLVRIVATLRAKPAADLARIISFAAGPTLADLSEVSGAAIAASSVTVTSDPQAGAGLNARPMWPGSTPDELTVREMADVIEQGTDAVASETVREIREVVAVLAEDRLQRAVLARRELADAWRLACLDPGCARLVASADRRVIRLVERRVTIEIHGIMREAYRGTPHPIVPAVECLAALFQSGDLAPELAGVPFPPDAPSGRIAEWVVSLTEGEAPRLRGAMAKAVARRMLDDVRAGFLGLGLGWPEQLGWPGSDGREVSALVGGIALVYLAQQDAQQSGLLRMTRFSANAASRAAVQVIAAGPPVSEDQYPWRDVATSEDGWAELVWDGRPRPVQLHLTLGRDQLEPTVIRGILDELSDDGLRDWATLHAMAAEQGATGRIRWTWNEHRERCSYYSRQIALQKSNDTDAANGVVRRLLHLKRAELRFYRQLVDRAFAYVRVGPFGLIDIPAGAEELTSAGRSLRVALLDFNPVIYAGAIRGAKHPHYTLFDERALALAPMPLKLYTFSVFDWEYAKGPVERKAATLWEYAGIRHGTRTQRKRWPEATRTLERALDSMCSKVGGDWSRIGGADGPEALYRLTPARPWADRVLLDVPPSYGHSSAGTPRTGAELAAKLKRAGLSLRSLEQTIGVPRSTISRVIRSGEKPLPADLVGRLVAAGW